MTFFMFNIRQTSLYADFMRRINWQVEKIDDVYVYIKKLPLLPAVIKIQRPQKLPPPEKLTQLAKKYHTKSVIIEPSPSCQLSAVSCQLLNDPYIHTKSIHIDLTADEKTIFNCLTSAKRRAVRRAQKAGVEVEISGNIDAFIKLKNKTSGLFLGFLTTHGFTRHLWNTFYPKNARVLLAYISRPTVILERTPVRDRIPNGFDQPSASRMTTIDKKYIAGILLLYSHNVAYYWMAAANAQGKKSFAPTLLIWEALKFAKKKRLKVFDFEGVYDERFPKRSKDWQGFSKFKEGFGGTSVYYPQPVKIRF